jgi:hypothetical protein
MATNPNDKPENKGLRGVVNKNFGHDEAGRSFLANFIKGAATGPTAGFSFRNGELLPAWGAIMLLSLTTGYVADKYEGDVNLTLPAQEILDSQTAGEFTAYQYDGQRYLLQNTEEGARLFVKDHSENSDSDDLYRLVSPDRAEEIAREMARLYLGEIGVNNEEIGALFQNDPDMNRPITFQYENLSVTFQRGEDGRFYMIGDNIDVNSAQAWDATSTSLREGYENWRSALTHFDQGNILSVEAQSPSGDYLETFEDKDLEFFLYAIGLLALGGGAAAGGQSIASSRRRHKKENQLRP